MHFGTWPLCSKALFFLECERLGMDGSVVDVLRSWRAAMRSSPNHYLTWNPCWTSITHSIHPGFSIGAHIGVVDRTIEEASWNVFARFCNSILTPRCNLLRTIDTLRGDALVINPDPWCGSSLHVSFFWKHLANIEDVLNVLLKNWHSLNKSCAACGEQSISPFVLWTLLCTDRRIPADSSAFYCGPAQIWNLLVCAWPQKRGPGNLAAWNQQPAKTMVPNRRLLELIGPRGISMQSLLVCTDLLLWRIQSHQIPFVVSCQI